LTCDHRQHQRAQGEGEAGGFSRKQHSHREQRVEHHLVIERPSHENQRVHLAVGTGIGNERQRLQEFRRIRLGGLQEHRRNQSEGEYGQGDKPIKRNNASHAMPEELRWALRPFRYRHHHDEAADDEKKIDARVPESRGSAAKPGKFREPVNMHKDDKKRSNRTKCLDIEEHEVPDDMQMLQNCNAVTDKRFRHKRFRLGDNAKLRRKRIKMFFVTVPRGLVHFPEVDSSRADR